MWHGSSETGLLEVRLSGPGIDVLQQQAQELMAALRAVPGTIDIKQDWDNLTFEVQVDVNQARARRAGLNSLEVAQSLLAFVFGKTLSDYWAGDIEVPIIARGKKEDGMACVMAWGLAIGTVFTLGVVPVLYAVLSYRPSETGGCLSFDAIESRCGAPSPSGRRLG